MPNVIRVVIGCIFPFVLAGCGSSDTPPTNTDISVENTPMQAASLTSLVSFAANSDLVFATNVGGPAYTGVDGTRYAAEEGVSGGERGTLDGIKGSQDAPLYETYRAGDIAVSQPLANGIYDVTLHFAEAADIQGGQRIFNATIQGETAIEDLDVMAFRDGKVFSALTVTVPNVNITSGELRIGFTASVGEPILSALVVRSKARQTLPWKLVWQDEFSGDSLDTSKWSPDIWKARYVNDEDQAYTSRRKNIRVEDGKLVIEAHREDYEGARFTSGRVHSSGKGDFLYGRFEIRAKLPRGQGTWPALWMLPSEPFTYATKCEEGTEWQGNPDCDAWPNSGEMDIMEHVGYQMNHVHGTVHNKAYYWAVWEQRKGRILLNSVDEEFHVYAMEWTPERIDIFVNDSHYFTYMNEHNGWETWPFDKPFHLIMNVAVGGFWGRAGGPIDDTLFPQRMLVDYARVYQLETTP